ncbi:MAG TPA: ribosome maturation factor RimM [Acidimicrobiia bacterium]|nr:ribosome maturation factor RimM [Acidimicrobiia bacterium]
MLVGTVVKPHGLKGEVVVIPQTDDRARFARGRSVHTSDGRALTVRRNIPGKKGWLISFEEIGDRSLAQELVGLDLLIDSQERRSLAPNEFWPDQLIGLEVREPSGQQVGQVTNVDDSLEQARLVISTPTGEVEVPFVDEFVPEVDLAGGYLVIASIPGLLD